MTTLPPKAEPAPGKSNASRSRTKPLRRALQASRFTPHLLCLAVFLAGLTLYLLTLAPGVVGGDAGEHQLAAPLLGIPHTTGYPLYILLGKLWTLLIPVGTMAWRMNLFSAVNGALAAAITALIVYHLVNRPETTSRPPLVTRPSPLYGALVAGLTLACGLTLWQWSAIAGVRSMNILFFALLTLEAIIWQQQSEIENPKSKIVLGWLALTIGLSLAHHRTTIFYLPSLLGWLAWHDPRLLRQPGRLLPLLGLAMLPLTLYAFTYFRGINNPPYSHEKISDLQSFWFLVGSGDSSGLFFSIDPAYLPSRLAFIGSDVLAQLSWPGVVLALAGGLWLLRQRPAHFILQASLVLLLLIFTLDFEVVNLNEAPTWYLMPAYFILAVWVGLGANWILDFGFWILDLRFTIYDLRFRTAIHYPLSTIYHLLSTILIISLLAYTLIWPNWQTLYAASIAPLDDWRQLLRGQQARRLVESSLPYVAPNSIIWGDWEQYTPFKYYQLVNGWRPDVVVRNPLDRWPEKVAAAHAAGQPVYLSRKPADLIGAPYLTMVGPLIYLQTAPGFEAPTALVPLNANFEGELELIGYHSRMWPPDAFPLPPPPPLRAELEKDKGAGGGILQLMFYWRTPQKVHWDYALSLRLLDPAGQEIYRQDATHPVLSSYPTSLWTPGEVVGDFYELPLPAMPGPFTLHLLPYRTEGPGQWHNLILDGSEPPQEGIRLGPFKP